jgi:hypothetical protein
MMGVVLDIKSVLTMKKSEGTTDIIPRQINKLQNVNTMKVIAAKHFANKRKNDKMESISKISLIEGNNVDLASLTLFMMRSLKQVCDFDDTIGTATEVDDIELVAMLSSIREELDIGCLFTSVYKIDLL